MSEKKSRVDEYDIMISGKLRELRFNKSKSQGEMGKIIGVSIQQIQKYERGTNRIPASKLYTLAKTFKIDIKTFFDFKESDYQINEIMDSNRGIKMLKYFDKLDNRTQQSLLGLMRSILKKEEEEDESKRTE